MALIRIYIRSANSGSFFNILEADINSVSTADQFKDFGEGLYSLSPYFRRVGEVKPKGGMRVVGKNCAVHAQRPGVEASKSLLKYMFRRFPILRSGILVGRCIA
jgi:hypothetical protein